MMNFSQLFSALISTCIRFALEIETNLGITRYRVKYHKIRIGLPSIIQSGVYKVLQGHVVRNKAGQRYPPDSDFSTAAESHKKQ